MTSTSRQEKYKQVPNPSKFLFDAPTPIAASELFNCDMVSVTVWNKTEDPDGLEQRTFKIMRAVICARSAYFEKAFKGNFKEAVDGAITLDNVSPWIFKVFVTWLYTGLIYIDNDGDDHVQSGVSKKRKLDDDAGMSNSSARKVPRTDDEHENLAPYMEASHPEKTSPTSPGYTPNESDDGADVGEHGDGGDVDEFGNEIFTYFEEWAIKSMMKYHAATHAPSEKNLSNPVTWPWAWLFEIYIFADQYETQRLREHIMNFVQLRLDQRRPRKYPYPGLSDTQRCVERLPSTSPLRRLLADIWAKNMTVSTHKNPAVQSQAKALARLPPSFLVECFLVMKGDDAIGLCGEEEEENCTSLDHDHRSRYSVHVIDRCRYHEHGDTREENRVCHHVWDTLRGIYECTVST